MNVQSQRMLRGLAKSWTTHAGVYIAILGYLQTQEHMLSRWLTPNDIGLLFSFIGILMIVLRAKTTESLMEKGSK